MAHKTIRYGRFGGSDEDYATRLILKDARSKEDLNARIADLQRPSRWTAKPCRAHARGKQCQLPQGHASHHQHISTKTKTKKRITLWRPDGDGGAIIVLRNDEVRCHGREATMMCKGPIYARRQNSAYENDASNFTLPVCDECFEAIQAEWADQWADLRASQL